MIVVHVKKKSLIVLSTRNKFYDKLKVTLPFIHYKKLFLVSFLLFLKPWKMYYTFIIFLNRTCRFLFDLSYRTKDDHVKHQLLYFLLGSAKLFRSIYRQGMMPRLMSVWISVGCYTKYIIIWVMYKQQEFISHGSEGRKPERAGCQHGSVLGENPLPGLQAANFFVYLPRCRGLVSSLASSDPILEGSTSWANLLPKIPTSKCHHTGRRVLTLIGGGGHIPFTAMALAVWCLWSCWRGKAGV